MPVALLSLLSTILPDIIRRILPAEKMTDAEHSTFTQTLQTELLAYDWKATEAVYQDRADARSLASIEIARGNALSSFLAAIVRPVWGLGCFALVSYSVISNFEIGAALQSIIELVLVFYFGGRTIEKIAPLAASVIKK